VEDAEEAVEEGSAEGEEGQVAAPLSPLTVVVLFAVGILGRFTLQEPGEDPGLEAGHLASAAAAIHAHGGLWALAKTVSARWV
jgi:hypothetical protein